MGALSMVAFVLSFFFGYPAVVVGVFALLRNRAKGLRGNGLAWAAIIIGLFVGGLQVIAFMFLFNPDALPFG